MKRLFILLNSFTAHRWVTRLRCCSSSWRRQNSCPKSSCRSPTLPCCTRRGQRLEGSGGGGADRPRTAPLPSKTTQLPMTIRIGNANTLWIFVFLKFVETFFVNSAQSKLGSGMTKCFPTNPWSIIIDETPYVFRSGLNDQRWDVHTLIYPL